MPELPEVETIVRDLQSLVSGARIEDVSVVHPDLIVGDPAEFARAVVDREIVGISRRAKNIVIDVGGDRLVINLGMTGRVLVVPAEAVEPSHLGVRFSLADGRTILYQDVRRFGRLQVMDAATWKARSGALGIEPLSSEFTPEHLYRMSRGSRSAVKVWLMDQKRIVGVGNIYANEALFRARISPRKAARRLSRGESERLHAAIRKVLQESIDFRGTTFLDYRDAGGEKGAFAARLRVYDRESEPCLTCGSAIRRIVQAGRSTFYCPLCQRG